MTTDKQVADSLTTQGKTISQEEAPPQTIIGTFPTLDSVLQAAMSEVATVNSVPAYPQLRENPPKVSRKERRALERSAAKQVKRSSK